MAEYIERETYRKRLADLEGWCQDLRKPGLKQALEMFDEIPAAEVAPVVHCWECEHSYEAVGGRFCTYGVCVDCEVPDDFYCGSGKRGETGEG